MKHIEEILKFLDAAARLSHEKALRLTGLDDKLTEIHRENRIIQARHCLRGLYYCYEDYLKDPDNFDLPEVKRS